MATGNYSILQQQSTLQLLSHMNTLLQQSSETLLCAPGSDCARNQEEEDLKQKYLQAKSNVQIAPDLLKDSAKKYFTFSKGTEAYNEWQEKELIKEVEKKAQEITRKFKEQIQAVNSANDMFETLAVNETNVNDLNLKYETELLFLKDHLNKRSSIVVTNDRKTYYELEDLDTSKWWHRTWFIIYTISALGLFASLFLVKNNLTMFKKIAIIVFLVLYPFLINRIMKWIIKLFQWIASFIPSSMKVAK
jgi:hypothetical protein